MLSVFILFALKNNDITCILCNIMIFYNRNDEKKASEYNHGENFNL